MAKCKRKNSKSKAAKSTDAKRKVDVLLAQAGDTIHVGIDVHKKKYHLAVWKNGTLMAHWTMPHDNAKVAQLLQPARTALKRVVYEAGPTGYDLARTLSAAGFPTRVVAPGSTPRAVSKGNKSDRLDCRKLAEYSAKDMLKFVGIPTAEEDEQRQLIRTRDDQMKKRKRIMQQIKSFLLYNEIHEPDGLQRWNKASVTALREMALSDPLRFRLDELLGELAYYSQALKRTEKQLAKYVAEHQAEIEILRSHPGVGEKTSRQFLAEVYQPHRFENSKQVVSYLGLAPKVESSGETRREGGVIKGGRGALRAMLVEASWRWIRDDKMAAQRYMKYVHNTGSGKKAIHAMARKLAVHLWYMLTRREAYEAAA